MEVKNIKWLKQIGKKTEHLRNAFKEKGMAGLCETITSELNSWRNETINIGILGQAEVGKSTFINSLRNLTADDKDAAPVGNGQSTSEPRFYRHPDNEKVRIWDFPGVGSTINPKDGYLDMIDFKIFDFFIIMTSKRFSENDIWLAKEIEKNKKRFYFVRSKFQNDIENEEEKKKNKGKTRKDLESQLKQQVYEDCKKNLEGFQCENKIFILDSYEKSLYDFEKLETHLIHDAFNISDGKHLAITSCLSGMTLSSIEEKKQVLERRIPKTALCAALALRIKDQDIMVLWEEMEFYKKQFNLDEKSLRRDVKLFNITKSLSSIEDSLQQIEKGSSEMQELNEIDQLIPFLPFINIGKTYNASKIWLQKTLDKITDKAVDVNLTMVAGLVRDSEV